MTHHYESSWFIMMSHHDPLWLIMMNNHDASWWIILMHRDVNHHASWYPPPPTLRRLGGEPPPPTLRRRRGKGGKPLLGSDHMWGNRTLRAFGSVLLVCGSASVSTPKKHVYSLFMSSRGGHNLILLFSGVDKITTYKFKRGRLHHVKLLIYKQ